MSELRRKNSVGVVEKAHLRTDKEAYDESYERIFGKKDAVKEDTIEEEVAPEVVESSAIDVLLGFHKIGEASILKTRAFLKSKGFI